MGWQVSDMVLNSKKKRDYGTNGRKRERGGEGEKTFIICNFRFVICNWIDRHLFQLQMTNLKLQMINVFSPSPPLSLFLPFVP
jgi:hypothetical protein